MKVDIIIAGFQKCGTTALYSFLCDHPDVIGSKPKEIDYFNSEFRFTQGTKYYHSRFKNTTLNPFKKWHYLDASPSYLNKGDVALTAQRIIEYNKDVKIIALKRDPLDRAFSAWNMYRKNFKKGKEDWWFEWKEKREGKKIEAIKRDKAEFDDFHLFVTRELACITNNELIECPILPIGFYKGIEHFQNTFKDNFMVINNEDLVESAGTELEKLSDFLNLKNHDWKKFDGKKVFSGNYNEKMPVKTAQLLKEFYGLSLQ